MVDSFGRKVTGLRIALTPRCNLNCIYCHHEGEANPNSEISDEMVVSVARAAAQLGVRSLKFTGGEPLLRRDLAGLIAQMPQDLDISLTTNGIFLAEQAGPLAKAGLDRVNVSLDSLRPQTYRSITGGREGDLEKVLAGIDAAKAAGLEPIKLNVVILKENEAEISDLIDFCREKGLILQLIELLDLRHQGHLGRHRRHRASARCAGGPRSCPRDAPAQEILPGWGGGRGGAAHGQHRVLRQLHAPARHIGREDQALPAAKRQSGGYRHLRLREDQGAAARGECEERAVFWERSIAGRAIGNNRTQDKIIGSSLYRGVIY